MLEPCFIHTVNTLLREFRVSGFRFRANKVGVVIGARKCSEPTEALQKHLIYPAYQTRVLRKKKIRSTQTGTQKN